MTVLPLSIQESVAHNGANYKVTINYDDFSAAGTTETIVALADADGNNLPAGTKVRLMQAETTTTFAGTSLSALVVDVGDGGDVDRLGDVCNVLTAGFALGTTITDNDHLYASADTVDAAFTSTGCNLDSLTAGSLDLYFRVTLPTPV